MEKFVVVIHDTGNETLNFNPVRYQSKDSLRSDIEAEIANCLDLDVDIHIIRFGETDFDMMQFIDWENGPHIQQSSGLSYDYRAYDILTLDEWFDMYQYQVKTTPDEDPPF